MRVPSGENMTQVTGPVCPTRVAASLPVAASHSRAVQSSAPVRTRLLSGENATVLMGAVCPGEGCHGLSGGRVPQPRRFVLRAGQDSRAVGRKRNGRDRSRVSRKKCPFAPARRPVAPCIVERIYG